MGWGCRDRFIASGRRNLVEEHFALAVAPPESLGVFFAQIGGPICNHAAVVKCSLMPRIRDGTGAKHLLLHPNCLEKKSFALHLYIQDCQFPEAW